MARAASPRLRSRVVPTARAAALVVLAAPLALVIAALAPAAWVAAPLLGGLVLALVAIDAALAGRLESLDLGTAADDEQTAADSVGVKVQADLGMLGNGRHPAGPRFAVDGKTSAVEPEPHQHRNGEARRCDGGQPGIAIVCEFLVDLRREVGG